jgi:Zn-finger nucleic acid-binding protein
MIAMKNIACSCEPRAQFERHEPADGLLAQRCPKCRAVVLALQDYLPWIERHDSERPAVNPSHLPGRETLSKARLCPSCQRVMARYRTGDADSFWLDFCPPCGVVWLDAGEWEQLEQSGLASYLDIILTERWQKDIQSRRVASFRDDLLRERFGAEFPEILRVRDWLGRQARRRDILAFLAESLSEKAAQGEPFVITRAGKPLVKEAQ